MRVGIGLPAAVPDTDMRLIGSWAATAEANGFASVGVIDRLVYENLDPMTALAAAAATTKTIGLLTTVTNVCWRANPQLLAKQLSSVVLLSGGRLTAGLGMGGWPADYDASGVPIAGRRELFESALTAMESWWRAAPGHRPPILLGGTAQRSLQRAAEPSSDGWVAPLFGLKDLEDGAVKVSRAWKACARGGRPRIVTGRYFSLGRSADAVADEYIRHYYGAEYFDAARADTLTAPGEISDALAQLESAGCDDVVLFPCSGDLDQVAVLANAVGPGEDAAYA